MESEPTSQPAGTPPPGTPDWDDWQCAHTDPETDHRCGSPFPAKTHCDCGPEGSTVHCFSHCPRAERDRLAARSKGGQRAHQTEVERALEDLPDVTIPDPPTSHAEAREFQSWVIDMGVRGRLPTSMVRALTSALKEFRHLHDASVTEAELKDRLQKLEERVNRADRE